MGTVVSAEFDAANIQVLKCVSLHIRQTSGREDVHCQSKHLWYDYTLRVSPVWNTCQKIFRETPHLQVEVALAAATSTVASTEMSSLVFWTIQLAVLCSDCIISNVVSSTIIVVCPPIVRKRKHALALLKLRRFCEEDQIRTHDCVDTNMQIFLFLCSVQNAFHGVIVWSDCKSDFFQVKT